jgi:hypothetical protein
MQEGNYVADEYRIILNGKPAHGRFDSMNEDPVISELDSESRSVMETCARAAYKFEDGEWRKSSNRCKKFQLGPTMNYKVDGEKIILFDSKGKPESTLFIRDGRIEECIGNALSLFYRKK